MVNHQTLMEQLLCLESKVMALLDMEELGQYSFGLKRRDNYNQNHNKEIVYET